MISVGPGTGAATTTADLRKQFDSKTEMPKWYDPCDPGIRDMLPSLQLLSCLLRQPHRGERCPGMSEGQDRRMSRRERPPESHTNIDHGIDYLVVGTGFEKDFEYAVGCVGRALMPGLHDDFGHEPDVEEYKRRVALEHIDWSDPEIRQWQYESWQEAVLRRVRRIQTDPSTLRRLEQLALEVFQVIIFADAVAAPKPDFASLASQVYERYLFLVKQERGG